MKDCGVEVIVKSAMFEIPWSICQKVVNVDKLKGLNTV